MDNAPPSVCEPPDVDWSLLPLDVLSLIFPRVGAVDVLMGAGLACRSWLEAAKLPDVWRVVDMENHEVLYKDGIDLRAMTKAAVDRSDGQLRSFAGKLFVNDELMEYIAERSPLLTSLRLVSCRDLFLGSVMHESPLLQRRSLELYDINLTVEDLTGLLDGCPLLEVLWMRGCFRIDEEGEHALRAKFSRIKTLTLCDGQGKTRAPIPTIGRSIRSTAATGDVGACRVAPGEIDGRGAGAGGGGCALLRGGRGGAGRGQDAQHVRQRLHRHRRRHGRPAAARRRRSLQPPPPLPPRRRPPPPRPHRPGIGACDEHAVEGVPRGQHEPAGPAVHGGEAVGDPAAVVHQGQRLPRQQRRRAGPRLPDHRQLPRRRLLRLPRRIRHRHRQDRPPLHRGERAAGQERLQRHRQPRHRLRLHRRARRRPRRDALPVTHHSSLFFPTACPTPTDC